VRTILLTAISVLLACTTYTGAAAHGRAADIDSLSRPAAVSAAPVFCGLCPDEDGCSVRERNIAERARDASRYRAPPEIFDAIDTASALTGVDFDYLLRTAALESSFNPFLEATTSSAAGLYQFIEQSWLYMLYEAGAEFGLADLASEIAVGDKGGFEVVDEEMREAILELRYDPELSARFAALFTWRNFEALSKLLGREPEAKELYLAHVFGASAAAQLIALAAEKPDVKAERHFRRAARANRAIFYHKDRKPRSVAEVIEYLAGKYRRIPVYRKGDDVRHSAPPPVWNPLLPNWHIGGDEIPLAMR
jgi:hypothetical protein